MTRYGLRDDQSERIKDLLPGKWATSVPPPVTIVALSRRCCTGTVREYHGLICRSASATGRITHRRFSRWAKAGVWERASFLHLAADGNNEYAMIDSTIVRPHQHSVGALKKAEDQALGRSRGCLSTRSMRWSTRSAILCASC